MDNRQVEEKGESLYEEIKNIINQYEDHKTIKEKIKEKFLNSPQSKREFPRDPKFLILRLVLFFNSVLIPKGDLGTFKKFFEIYGEEIEEYDWGSFTVFALQYEGIYDLYPYDVSRAPSTTIDDGLTMVSFRDQKLMPEIYRRSKEEAPVLIVGETGTSKGLLARAMHRISNRRKAVFESINCAAIPEALLESELFGYEKGAFTEAKKPKKGILEIADKGTVFLDEIGKMSTRLQAKLLKVIEEKEIRPLGSEHSKKIDVKFIVASQPEDVRISNEKIIPDLLWRLGIPDCIQMPTLQERISQLDDFVIASSMAVILGKPNWRDDIRLRENATRKLLEHRYKGNYRELENILRYGIRCARIKNRKVILPEDVEEIMNQSKMFYETDGEMSLESVNLRDLFEYADKKRALIIEAKMKQIRNEGKTLRSVCLDEGLNYQNIRKKAVNIIGKKIGEIE